MPFWCSLMWRGKLLYKRHSSNSSASASKRRHPFFLSLNQHFNHGKMSIKQLVNKCHVELHFLILRVVTWMIYECFLFCDVVHESLVCSEQLKWALFFRKILHVLQNLQFCNIFCIFEPFPAATVWFWDPSFHTEDDWGTQTQLLKKGSNVHWCSRRTHDALRALRFLLRENFWTGWRQIKYNLPWSSN